MSPSGRAHEHAFAGHAVEAGRLVAGTRAARTRDAGRDVHRHRHLRAVARRDQAAAARSEEHTSELQSLMRTSYAVFCLKKQRQTILQHPRVYIATSQSN